MRQPPSSSSSTLPLVCSALLCASACAPRASPDVSPARSEAAILVGAECWDDGLCRFNCDPPDPDCPAYDPQPCTGPTCDGLCTPHPVTCGRIDAHGNVTDPLAEAAANIKARYPNAGAAHDDLNVNGNGSVWDWAHMKKSVDGFGATMATVNHRAGFEGDGWDASEDDVKADGDLKHPSLLFFDRTGGTSTWRSWPLIGFGYFFDFEPCARPTMDCVGDNDWFIHEAGYHHSLPGQDGGMSLADDNDLCDGGWFQAGCSDAEFDCSYVDLAGCEDIDDVDLELHVNRVKHGRGWDLHMWLRDGEDTPTIARLDPDERWQNAPSGRIALDNDRFFFTQEADVCCDGVCR